jgi:hypothetical protein
MGAQLIYPDPLLQSCIAEKVCNGRCSEQRQDLAVERHPAALLSGLFRDLNGLF